MEIQPFCVTALGPAKGWLADVRTDGALSLVPCALSIERNSRSAAVFRWLRGVQTGGGF